MPAARTNRRNPALHLLVGAFVLAAGALEAWFGRPELFGDDISYLDVANSIHAHDWRAAFNPLWSIGYPLLLTCFKPFFAPTIHGELTAVFTLNIVIYLAAWLSFLFFLKTAATFPVPHSSRLYRDGWDRPATLIPAACIFTCTQICFGRVSSIGPDQLVSCLFFLASALVLDFILQPSARNGILLGLTLGLGFLAKAVFLPLSVILLATALLPYRRRLRPAIALSAPLALFALMLPYAAGLSWAIGRPTIGESGALNYAFHVNRLPHWMGWQGGPPRLRHPLHPVHLLREHPAVFAFGEPFHVTYPPQFAMHFWYDGYKHFFSPLNAIRAVATNLHALEAVLHENWPFTLAIFLCAALALYKPVPHPSRPSRWVGLPLWLPSLLGIALYVQVHLEGRYIAPFVAILAIAVGCPIFGADLSRVDQGDTPSTRFAHLGAIILIAATLLTLYPRLKPTSPSDQWRMAAFLVQSGLHPGDKVASVSTLNDIRCTWAYAARLHIVADIGNDAYTPQDQQRDFNLFWSQPAVQQDVLRLFRQQGAAAVIVPHAQSPALNPSWQSIPGTDAWLLRL
jgi:hypothetical protein